MPVCIPIVGPTLEQANEQLEKATLLTDLIEVRFDLFTFRYDQFLQKCSNTPARYIYALRSSREGGGFKDKQEEQAEHLKRFLSFSPAYLDIELSLAQVYPLKNVPHGTQIILSSHTLHSKSNDTTILDHMRAVDSNAIYKIVNFAEQPIDGLKMAHWIKNSAPSCRKLIGLSMGIHGILTRVLSNAIGNYFTFAALEKNLQSAPGQLPFEILLHSYRFNDLKSNCQFIACPSTELCEQLNPLLISKSLRFVPYSYSSQDEMIALPLLKELGFIGILTPSTSEHDSLWLEDNEWKHKTIHWKQNRDSTITL